MRKLLFILMLIPAICSFGQETEWQDIDYVGDGILIGGTPVDHLDMLALLSPVTFNEETFDKMTVFFLKEAGM